MPDLETLVDKEISALGDALKNFIRQLFGFRTFLGVVEVAAGLAGGWIHPLLFREQGERTVRAWFIYAPVGIVGLVYMALGFITPVTGFIILWAMALGFADWLSAMDRRRTEAEEGYSYSRFIGWPRFLPANGESYWQQGVFVFLIGACFFTWSFDRTGGIWLMVAGVSVLLQLWVIRARWREDAMDRLDGEWLSIQVATKAQTMGGAGVTETATQVADIVSTADFLRRWSI